MANKKHLDILKQGVETWNQWREEHPDIQPVLSYANFRKSDLRNANLNETNLYTADLVRANLVGANLYKANLHETLQLHLVGDRVLEHHCED
jgi:Pentapeptide repeats (8 copies)